MAKRQRNDGLRKICTCPLRSWARCAHPWYFSFKPKHGARVRVSIDRHVGEHVESLEQAKTIAAGLRTAVAAGTYPPPDVTPTPEPVVITFELAAGRHTASVPLLRERIKAPPAAGTMPLGSARCARGGPTMASRPSGSIRSPPSPRTCSRGLWAG